MFQFILLNTPLSIEQKNIDNIRKYILKVFQLLLVKILFHDSYLLPGFAAVQLLCNTENACTRHPQMQQTPIASHLQMLTAARHKAGGI